MRERGDTRSDELQYLINESHGIQRRRGFFNLLYGLRNIMFYGVYFFYDVFTMTSVLFWVSTQKDKVVSL